jgi:hypothetical protein
MTRPANPRYGKSRPVDSTAAGRGAYDGPLAIIFLRGVQTTSAGLPTQFVRQVPANRPPLLQMLFLWTGLLLLPSSAWPRPLSVGRRPHAMTYKVNAG